jgi:hypothetical protein
MAYCVDTLGEPTGYADQPSFRTSRTQHFLGGIAFAAVILASGWTVYVNLFEIHPVDAVAAPTVTVVQQKAPEAASTPQIAPRKRSLFVAPVFDIALIDATKSFGLPPVSFSRGTQVRQAMQKPAQPQRKSCRWCRACPCRCRVLPDSARSRIAKRKPTTRSKSCSADVRRLASRSPMRPPMAAFRTTAAA